MIRVQFKNKKAFYDVEFTLISDVAVKLSGSKLKKNTSGFNAYRLNGDMLGDYSDYKKCTEVKDGFIFEKNRKDEKS